MDEIDQVAQDLLTTTHHHKQNYETLKDQHISLKEDYIALESEYVELLKESKLVKDKYVTMLNMAHFDNQKLKKECTDAQKKVLTPKQVEMIRLDTRKEVMTEYQKKIDDMKEENSILRQKVAALERKSQEREGDFEMRMQEKSGLVESLQSKIERMEEDHSANLKRFLTDQQRENIEIELTKTRQENGSLSATVNELRSELKRTNSEFHSQTLKHTKSYNKLKNNEIKVKNKNSEQLMTIEQLSQQNDQLVRQLEDRKKRGLEREKEFLKINKEIEEFRREIEHINSLAIGNINATEIETKLKLEHEAQKNKKLQMQIEELKCQIEMLKQSVGNLKRKLANKDVKLIKEIESFQKNAAKNEALHHRLRINAEKNCNELREQLNEKSCQYKKMEQNLSEKYEKKLSEQKSELSEKLNETAFMLNKMKSEQFLAENSAEDILLTKRMLGEATERNNELAEENRKMKKRIKVMEDSIREGTRGDFWDGELQRETQKMKKADQIRRNRVHGGENKIERLMRRIGEFENKLYAQENCFKELNYLTC